MESVKINGNTYKFESDIQKIKFSDFKEKFTKLLEVENEASKTSIYDEAAMIEIVLGCDYADAMDCPAEIINKLSFWKHFDLIKQPIPEFLELPLSVVEIIKRNSLKGKINIPKNLLNFNLTVGQLQFYRGLLNEYYSKHVYKELDETIKKITEKDEEITSEEIEKYTKFQLNLNSEYIKNADKLAAIVLQTVFFGSFKPDENQKLADKLNELLFVEIVPIAFFLIKKSQRYLIDNQNN